MLFLMKYLVKMLIKNYMMFLPTIYFFPLIKGLPRSGKQSKHRTILTYTKAIQDEFIWLY